MRTTAEVVIVGGGCMGASVAYHLARRGVTAVVLLEREALLATGSTGRNAGGVRHQFSHPSNIALSIESIRCLERFEDEVGATIDFHQDGYLFLLSSDGSVREFEAAVAEQRRLGVDVRWLGAEAARELAPGLDVAGVIAATYCARDGIADPNGVTMGFARAAQAAGVEIRRETEAVAIRTAGQRIVGVETTRGHIDAPIVVNAAGPWAGGVGRLAGVDLPVNPLRRHIFIAQPPSERGWFSPDTDGRARPVAPANRLMVIDFDTSFYFHREGANLLFGMGDPNEPYGFDTTVRWDLLPDVVETAVRRLPVLADCAVSHAWAGLYEMTPDAMPLVGAVRSLPGFYVIAGFSGHGFQHSPAAGRVLADVVAGVDPAFDLSPFAPERFSTGTPHGERHFV
ncbi:MAG: NAD(P)/FAD-dependent oxidoreductase [Bacteroidales bacterium]